MSTGNEREALRRALRIVDGIEPRADGLQRIQARLSPPRPLAVAWAETTWTTVRMGAPDALRGFLEWLRSAGSLASLAWERFGPSTWRTSGRRTSRANGWLRPAAVLGVTIFVVAVGTYVAIDGQQVFSPSAANSIHNGGGGTGPGGGAQGNASTNSQGNSSLGTSGPARGKGKATCKPSKSSATPKPSTTPGGIQSTSPSGSPSDSTGGPSPSPTVTDGTTPSPATTGLSASGPVGSASPAIGSLAGRAVLTSSSAPASTLPPCPKQTPVPHNSPAPTTHASPAVVSFGKLDDGR